MTIAERIYRLTHRAAIRAGAAVPYYWQYPLGRIVAKPIRKFFSAVIIPSVPFNGLRIWCYRRCGYRIGRNTFIGMRCYLDDMCHDLIVIGDNVTISYGVYFACHGRNQDHNRIVIGDNAYIGMRCNIVARHPLTIGRNAVVGAGSLVNRDVAESSVVVGVPAKPLNNSILPNGGGGYVEYRHCLVWNGASGSERELLPEEASALMRASGAWMLRNCWDWDCGRETDFWEVIQDRHRDISELPSKVRNQIRRCLRDCDIRRITREQLVAADGYEVYRAAFGRYRDVSVSIAPRADWEQALLSRPVDPAAPPEYWGVYLRDGGRLIAWAQNRIIGDRVSYSSLKAIPEMMNRHYPYFGLLYEMGRHYLQERGFRSVSDGWRSVTEHSGIQPFLEKNFLFRKAYCRMRLRYAPWFGVAVKALYPFRRLRWLPLSVGHILNFESINRKMNIRQ